MSLYSELNYLIKYWQIRWKTCPMARQKIMPHSIIIAAKVWNYLKFVCSGNWPQHHECLDKMHKEWDLQKRNEIYPTCMGVDESSHDLDPQEKNKSQALACRPIICCVSSTPPVKFFLLVLSSTSVLGWLSSHHHRWNPRLVVKICTIWFSDVTSLSLHQPHKDTKYWHCTKKFTTMLSVSE